MHAAENVSPPAAMCRDSHTYEIPAGEIIRAIDAATADGCSPLSDAFAEIGTTVAKVKTRAISDSEIASALERHAAAKTGVPIPSPEELRARCLAIQAEWSDRERESRLAAQFRDVIPQPLMGKFRPGL